MEQQPKRTTWIVIVVAFMVLMALVGFAFPATRPPRGTASPMMVVILAELLIAVGIWAVYLRPKEVLGEPPRWPSPREFHTRSLITLAFSECAVLLSWVFLKRGMFMNMHYLVVAIALGIVALLVLPTGLIFWKHQEEAEAEEALG